MNLSKWDVISVDFARTGYVICSVGLYDFYDRNFNYRKQRYTDESGIAIPETHVPFGTHYILEQYIQSGPGLPGYGNQVRLVDSNLHIIKKAVLYPPGDVKGLMTMLHSGAISVRNENEIWASGTFGDSQFTNFNIYTLTKLDSNLNIQCQHFLGYDTEYYPFGIQSLESGGSILFGCRINPGDDKTLGRNIWAIRVGENCELPEITGVTNPDHQLTSISVYPNPTINSLTFDVHGFDPASLRVEIFNPEGITLFSADDLSYEIRVNDLPAGQYFYRILQKEKILGVGAWVKK